MRLSYALPNRNKLIIPDNVVARLLSYRQKKNDIKKQVDF